MQINKEVLKSLNPCFDRYEHFLENNANFDGSFNDFLDLTNLDYDDKTWVAEKILTQNQAVIWSVLCAESVLHIFEKKYPKDKRPRDCINFLKTVKDFNNLNDIEKSEIKRHLDIIQVSYATDCVAYAATAVHYATYNSARAASGAANYAIHTANNAAYSAAYAAKNAGEDVSAAGNNQQALNIQFLKQVTSL